MRAIVLFGAVICRKIALEETVILLINVVLVNRQTVISVGNPSANLPKQMVVFLHMYYIHDAMRSTADKTVHCAADLVLCKSSHYSRVESFPSSSWGIKKMVQLRTLVLKR